MCVNCLVSVKVCIWVLYDVFYVIFIIIFGDGDLYFFIGKEIEVERG